MNGPLHRRHLSLISRGLLPAVAAAVVLTACVTPRRPEPLRHYFDESSGANVTCLERPLLFHEDRPLLASHARDYISMGPVEVARSGQHDYLIWFVVWSTIDRRGQAQAPGPDDFKTVYLLLDGEPMELRAAETGALDAMLQPAPYAAPLSAGFTTTYPVTRDQLARLAEVSRLEIRTGAGGNRYLMRQRGEGGIGSFAAYIAGR